LHSPEDEAVFTEDTPTFAWGNQERIDSFHIVIWADSSLGSLTLIDKLVTDTTYTIPSSIFEGLPRGKYFWKAANIMEGVELWSEVRFFQIDHDLPALDLDTTYYPLALGYKWVYQNWVDGDIYDTNSVEVTEIISETYQITYTITTISTIGMQDFSYDLPQQTILLGNLLYCYRRVNSVTGSNDTLHLHSSESGAGVETGGYWSSSTTRNRVKELGLLYQEWTYWAEAWGEQTFEDRLLYFIKGEDTMWTAD